MKLLKKHIIIKILLGLFVLTTYIMCQTENNKQSVHIKGKLINPKTDEIYISRDIFMLNADTLKLINENTVNSNIHITEEGLYIFYIFPEFQTIYLKPGDSLAFHINVEEFDESLSFSGSLGAENNLLIDIFLENESESNYFYQHNFKFSPQIFLKKIDSFKHKKEKIINNYYQHFLHPDNKFNKIVNSISLSADYNLKEKYPLKNKGIKLPKNYYDFEQVLKHPMGDPNIFYMYLFTDAFLSRKINKNIPSEKLHIERAKKIEKYIADKSFKDNLLAHYCSNYIKNNHIFKNDSVIKNYFKLINNQDYKDYFKRLIQKNSILNKGQLFPSVELIDRHHHNISTDSIFKNNKVCLSFWDLKQHKNFVSNLQKLENLKKQFPDIEFIIINITPDNFEQWLMGIPENETYKFFKIKNQSDIFKINPYHMSQVFLIKNGIIKECYENMYRPNFVKIMENFNQEK